MTDFVLFRDLDAPLALSGCRELLDPLRAIVPGWPFRVSADAPATPPFFRIEAGPKPGRYACIDLIEGDRTRTLDAVNAVCDMIAALSRALPASDRRVLCLHAAGVAVGGRLVLFPSTRRAGKSTLSVALAARGHAVFSDDFVPVSRDSAGRIMGRSCGVAPRLRLPLPATAAPEFRAWFEAQEVIANPQYAYLALTEQPSYGDELPVGALVLLERGEGVSPTLEAIPGQFAMDALLKQNFTRDRHSGEVLEMLAGMLTTLPSQRLVYDRLEDAVALLEERFATWDAPVPKDPARAGRLFTLADYRANPVNFDPSARYRQATGAAVAPIGEALYLADDDGGAIYRLDPLSEAIWLLLEEWVLIEEIAATLAEAFPDTDPGVISDDVQAFLKRLHKARLVVRD